MNPWRVELGPRIALCAFGSTVAVVFGEPHLIVACALALLCEIVGLAWCLRP